MNAVAYHPSPVEALTPPDLTWIAELAAPTRPPVTPSRILHIEDDDDDALLVHLSFLDRFPGPLHFERAQRLNDARFRLQHEPFDAVILDLELPDSIGLKGIRELHEAAPDVPIVVLSGHDDGWLPEAAEAEGAAEFLTKVRFSPDDIVEAVFDAIGLAEKHVEIGAELPSEDEPSGRSDRRHDAWLRTWCSD